MAVFVLDKKGKPWMPCTEKRARLLLDRGRARVHRVMPFVLRLTDRNAEDCALQPLRLKFDPGSKTTGMALVREAETVDAATGELRREAAVLNLFERVHRGRQISEALTARRAMRRRRRGANLRYRAVRFRNRRKPEGWLAPSLRHRVDTTQAWVKRLRLWSPVTGIAQELVRFDLQQIENPEIAGIEYQQGELAGVELREVLLEKWGRCCAYCGAKEVPLQVEHLQPKAKGGSNRASHLTLACAPCNTAKGAKEVREFVKEADQRKRLLDHAKAPLRDAAAVNATRWALFHVLQATGLPVETGSGGRTKWNRARLAIPKTHAFDAVCVGRVEAVSHWQRPTLQGKGTGRGSVQRTRLTKHGFPRSYLLREKQVHGFQTGDLVRSEVSSGKKAGAWQGRVAVRRTGNFNIQTAQGVVQGISHRHCLLIQRGDGYGYSFLSWKRIAALRAPAIPPATEVAGFLAEVL